MTISSILILHVGAGLFGLLSGTAALIFRKGSGPHQAAGKIFVISMSIMGVGASVLGYLKQEWNDVVGGITVIYVVATAWMTLHRKAGKSGRFEIVALLVIVACAGGNLALGLHAAHGESGLMYGFPAGFYYFFAGLATAFAAGDLKLILRNGIAGKQRIARHIWRMSYAMFTATGSLFLGQMKIFPEPIREIYILAVPVIAVILLMIYWLVRVRFTGWQGLKILMKNDKVFSYDRS